MSAINELYQEVILDHNKKPRNFHQPDVFNRHADGYNPLCGDKLTLYLDMDGEVVRDVGFLGSGCAISKASASMMTDSIKGRTRQEVQELFEVFHQMVTGHEAEGFEPESLGKLAVFSGVAEFPARVKCASLAWHTLKSAMDGRSEVASTE